MPKVTMSGLVYLLIVLGLLNVAMYLQQSGMIFHPYGELSATPVDWGLDYEDIKLNTADGTQLHGWYIPQQRANNVLLFLHGNAGNISHRGDSIAIFHRLGLNVLIFDYRGYGQSQGKPTEAGLYQDAVAAWRYLTLEKGYESKNIILFGRSLGGAVAAKLASEVQAGGLILESTLSSARDFANHVFPVLSRLVMLRYDFNTADAVRRARCPVLVLHSREDEIMPFFLGEKVFDAASEPKVFVKLQGGHNSGFLQSQPQYERALSDFLATLP